MTLRTALLISLSLGAAIGVLAFRFLAPIPLAASPLPDLIDPADLGQAASAVLTAVAIYAALAALLIGSSMAVELSAARASLSLVLASGRRDHVRRAEWDGAFAGTSLEALARRILHRSSDFDDDRLLLTSPFSIQESRGELRQIYQRRLVVSQVWTSGIALVTIAVTTLLPSISAEAGRSLALLSTASAALVFTALAVSWLTTTSAMEALLETICDLPFTLESSARLKALPSLAVPARVGTVAPPSDVALALRNEGEALIHRLAEVASRIAVTDRDIMTQLIETVTHTAVNALDSRISGFLQTAEGLIAATQAVAEKLDTRLATLPEIWAQNYATERREITQVLADIAAAGHTEVKALRQLLAETVEKQAGELERIASESWEASGRLAEMVATAGTDLEEARRASVDKTTQLVQTVEAYTSRLLPAIRRLEACDDRVVTAVGRQDETLARLALVVNELSGTLEMVQTALAQGLGGTPGTMETLRRDQCPLAGLANTADPVDLDPLSISGQLRALLEEMKDAPSSD